jgi:hypothetical protein
MTKLKNILLLLIALLSINNGTGNSMSINFSDYTTFITFSHKPQFIINNFVEDSNPNEDFDLEEDYDDTEDDFMENVSSKNLFILSTITNTNSYYYSYSHQSVKRFILYCSLKLYS